MTQFMRGADRPVDHAMPRLGKGRMHGVVLEVGSVAARCTITTGSHRGSFDAAAGTAACCARLRFRAGPGDGRLRIAGMPRGIRRCEKAGEPPRDFAFETLETLFQLVYGRELGSALAVQTVEEAFGQQLGLIWASEWAIGEVEKIYHARGKVQAQGFILAANGQSMGM